MLASGGLVPFAQPAPRPSQENTRCATDFRSITMATDAPAAGAPDQAADATSVDIELVAVPAGQSPTAGAASGPGAAASASALQETGGAEGGQGDCCARTAARLQRELALEYATEPYHILPYKWSHYAEDWVQVRTEVRRDRVSAPPGFPHLHALPPASSTVLRGSDRVLHTTE